MKKYLHTAFFLLAMIAVQFASAQELAPDQNPNYQLSRNKYMALADSVNQWHGTTTQQTYKAYDWYEAKMERKNERIRFRRDLRRDRVHHRYYRQPYYYNPYNPYNRNYRNHWSFWWF